MLIPALRIKMESSNWLRRRSHILMRGWLHVVGCGRRWVRRFLPLAQPPRHLPGTPPPSWSISLCDLLTTLWQVNHTAFLPPLLSPFHTVTPSYVEPLPAWAICALAEDCIFRLVVEPIGDKRDSPPLSSSNQSPPTKKIHIIPIQGGEHY